MPDYRQYPRFRLLAVERQNRGLGALRCRHCDDGETARLAVFALNLEIDFGDIAVWRKQILQLPFGRAGGEIGDV